MKLFDGVGREHEEFKLQLDKQKQIELAAIAAQEQIAANQADVVSQALKSARIDIVGGDTNFFDKIVNSISNGKSVDRMVHNSQVLTDVAHTFFNGNPEYFEEKLFEFTTRFGLKSDDIKNLSIAALLARMISQADDGEENLDRPSLVSFWDPELYRCVGLDPAASRIVGVKSPAAFRAAYGPFAAEIVNLDVPGVCTPNLKRFPWQRVPRPIFPLDDLDSWR